MRKDTISAILAALLVAVVARADQPGTLTTQTSSRIDAANVWVGQVNGATSCNAVSQTAANDTLNFPASGGQFGYVTELIVQDSVDATGVTQTGTILIGGVSNSALPANISFASSINTAQGFPPPMVIPFNPPLKSSAPGTAISFTPSATQSAHNYLCMSALGYYSSN